LYFFFYSNIDNIYNRMEEIEAKKQLLREQLKVMKERNEFNRNLNQIRLKNLRKAQEALGALKKIKLEQLANLQQS
jgi:hypothetical protein